MNFAFLFRLTFGFNTEKCMPLRLVSPNRGYFLRNDAFYSSSLTNVCICVLNSPSLFYPNFEAVCL